MSASQEGSAIVPVVTNVSLCGVRVRDANPCVA